MQNTTEQVDTLKEKLVITMEHVGVEKEKTDALILVVNREAAEAAKEEEATKEIEDATNIVKNAADQAMANATKELEAAVPAMLRAEAAVDCLSVAMI